MKVNLRTKPMAPFFLSGRGDRRPSHNHMWTRTGVTAAIAVQNAICKRVDGLTWKTGSKKERQVNRQLSEGKSVADFLR